MLRLLATAFAILAVTALTLCFHAPRAQSLTPGITLIGKDVVSGSCAG